MKTLFILNDAPYGTERSYNGPRLAGALSKHEDEEVKVFSLVMQQHALSEDKKFHRGTTISKLC